MTSNSFIFVNPVMLSVSNVVFQVQMLVHIVVRNSEYRLNQVGNFDNFIHPTLSISFGWNTKSRRFHLVYVDGLSMPGEVKNTTRGKSVTHHGLTNFRQGNSENKLVRRHTH